MSLLNVDDLKSLSPAEQEHLQRLEEALQNVLLTGQVQAASEGLNVDRMARAATTIMLSLAARHTLGTAAPGQPEEEFARAASQIMRWATERARLVSAFWH